MSNTHLALVLAPITNTINQARKTRELWASSFVFSRLMYHLLKTLPSGQIIVPAFSAQTEHKYGAGLYHDRCIVKLVPDEPNIDIDGWIKKGFTELNRELNEDVAPENKTDVSKLIQVQVLRANCEQTKLDTTAYGKDDNAREKDAVAIHRINRLLDNLELRPLYRPVEDDVTLIRVLDNHIHQLYKTGYQEEDDKKSIFITMDKGDTLRLPSVPEIALREFKDHHEKAVKELYRELVEDPLNFRIKVLKKVGGRSKDLPRNVKEAAEAGKLPKSWGKRFEDTQVINELLYAYLQDRLNEQNDTEGILKMRHKYLAVVMLDGDGLGSAITALSQNDPNHEKFAAFSANLLKYAKEAVVKVVEYGGLPIFSGGDDLLFLAPVAMPPQKTADAEGDLKNENNAQNNTPENVLTLCAQLDQLFKGIMGHGMSLSGGVSVNYYKFPLGEAVEEARNLEKSAKKFVTFDKVNIKGLPEADWEPTRKKNALNFRLRKHSGQTFEATFSMGSKSFASFHQMLKFGPELDEAFLTSAMYRFQSAPELLAEVVRDDTSRNRRAGYKQHQFGKGGPKHNGEYLDQAIQLAYDLFREYGDVLTTKEYDAIKKQLVKDGRSLDPLVFKHTETLFAALRFKQFLIQPDHA